MSEAKSYYEYNYKIEFQIWKENEEFERQNISVSQPPLESTPIVTNTSNAKMSHLDSTPVDMKIPDPKLLTLPTESSNAKKNREKSTYQRIQSQTRHSQTHSWANLIRLMTASTEDQKASDAIKKKKYQKYKKLGSSESSSMDYDLSDKSGYKIKRRNKKRNIIKGTLSNDAQNSRKSFWRQRINRISYNSNWIRIHYSIGFIFLPL